MAGSRRTRRPAVVVGAIATLVALTLTLVAASVGGDRLTRDDDDGSTTTTIPLNAAARELLALLEKDKEATFHAEYAATSAEQPDASIVIETWRKPPRVRQDSRITSANKQTIHTVALLLGERAVRCAQLSQSAWSCRSRPQDATTDDLLFGGVRDQLGKGPVTARDDVIDGRRVRCFTLRAEGRTSELCATPAGIPVRVQSEGAGLRLVGFDTTVDDEVFVPPAEPTPEPS